MKSIFYRVCPGGALGLELLLKSPVQSWQESLLVMVEALACKAVVPCSRAAANLFSSAESISAAWALNPGNFRSRSTFARRRRLLSTSSLLPRKAQITHLHALCPSFNLFDPNRQVWNFNPIKSNSKFALPYRSKNETREKQTKNSSFSVRQQGKTGLWLCSHVSRHHHLSTGARLVVN